MQKHFSIVDVQKLFLMLITDKIKKITKNNNVNSE